MRPNGLSRPTRHNGNVVPIYKSAATPGADSRPPMLNSVRPAGSHRPHHYLMRRTAEDGNLDSALSSTMAARSGVIGMPGLEKRLARYRNSIHELASYSVPALSAPKCERCSNKSGFHLGQPCQRRAWLLRTHCRDYSRHRGQLPLLTASSHIARLLEINAYKLSRVKSWKLHERAWSLTSYKGDSHIKCPSTATKFWKVTGPQ